MARQGLERQGPVGHVVAVTATLKTTVLITTQQERNKMKEKIKTLWAEALRSGEYDQGSGCLKKKDCTPKFCCLGVLTDLYCKDKNVSWEEATELARESDYRNYNPTKATSYMPECVASWAGFLESELSDQGDDGLDVELIPEEWDREKADVAVSRKFSSRNASVINDNYINNPAQKSGSFEDIADLIEENL